MASLFPPIYFYFLWTFFEDRILGHCSELTCTFPLSFLNRYITFLIPGIYATHNYAWKSRKKGIFSRQIKGQWTIWCCCCETKQCTQISFLWDLSFPFILERLLSQQHFSTLTHLYLTWHQPLYKLLVGVKKEKWNDGCCCLLNKKVYSYLGQK